VLEQAARQLAAWKDDVPQASDLTMSVNLSARQCTDPNLVADVAAVLRETGLEPGQLKLEITEGVLLDICDAVADVLSDLRALGVELGLDDFGMGYSALSYLQRFPFQTIKIDRTFVGGMHDRRNAEVVRAIVAMAAGLDMNVTAEGVETADQMQGLRDMSCELGQGFYFREALRAEDAARMVAQSAVAVSAGVAS
jgi:Amt family ammonium transporter